MIASVSRFTLNTVDQTGKQVLMKQARDNAKQKQIRYILPASDDASTSISLLLFPNRLNVFRLDAIYKNRVWIPIISLTIVGGLSKTSKRA